MTTTYDEGLSTDRDWVRFLVDDTDTTDAAFLDAEIDAILAEETATGPARKYYGAARALSVLMTRRGGQGVGVIEKQVSRNRTRFGVDASASQLIEARIRELRMRGARLLAGKPFSVKAR